MKILHVLLTTLSIPPTKYGGTERVLWGLYQGQIEQGHDVRFLLKANANNSAHVDIYDEEKSMEKQIGDWPDIVHFHWPYDGELHKPFVCTEHSNSKIEASFPINTIYLSKKHASNNNAQCYVHNGLYWQDYGEPNLTSPKDYVHFLAKTAWRVKNIQGAVRIAKQADVPMHVLGGDRFNLRRSPYFFPSSSLTFHGMIGGNEKNAVIRDSQALIFPVLWDEPFGLSVTESLYLGCPVFATPYGSLPDIISRDDIGLLSDSYEELTEGVKNIAQYNRRTCHEHAKRYFSHSAMAASYQECYEKVLAGENLNSARPHSNAGIKGLKRMTQ